MRGVLDVVVPAILEGAALDMKAKAGGRLVRSAPRGRLPILTGRLVESIHWIALSARGGILVGVHYLRYINIRGDNLVPRILVEFIESDRAQRHVRRALRNAGFR